MLKIAPSILSADFASLAAEIHDVEKGGADWIHVDVMDGLFVPNITIGAPVVQAVRPHCSLPLDVHLMVQDPERHIPAFAQAGADIITVHAEACRHLHRTLRMIKDLGVKAGVALNPATPVEMIRYVLADIDMVLIMTVNPGFGGQKFIPAMVKKIKDLRALLQEGDYAHIDVEVDGGINEQTARQAAAAGANVLVAGSAVFNHPNRAEAIAKIKGA